MLPVYRIHWLSICLLQFMSAFEVERDQRNSDTLSGQGQISADTVEKVGCLERTIKILEISRTSAVSNVI
jgi:hypothetical protein